MNILILGIAFIIMGLLLGFTQDGHWRRHRQTIPQQKIDILIDGFVTIIGIGSYIYAFVSGGIVFGVIAVFVSMLMIRVVMPIGISLLVRLVQCATERSL